MSSTSFRKKLRNGKKTIPIVLVPGGALIASTS